MKRKIIIGILLAVLAGWLLGRGARSQPKPAVSDAVAHEEIWTCSMHPQIRQPKPGQCPICGMDLIPAVGEDASADEGPRTLTMSENAQALAEVEAGSFDLRIRPVEFDLDAFLNDPQGCKQRLQEVLHVA